MLNYNIKGTEMPITDELRSYVEKKLAPAEKFLQDDPSVHVDVELAYQALRNGDHYRAEFTIGHRGGVHRAESWGETMHAAIDLCAGELISELSRNKKKRLHLVRRSAARVKDYLRGFRRKI